MKFRPVYILHIIKLDVNADLTDYEMIPIRLHQ